MISLQRRGGSDEQLVGICRICGKTYFDYPPTIRCSKCGMTNIHYEKELRRNPMNGEYPIVLKR